MVELFECHEQMARAAGEAVVQEREGLPSSVLLLPNGNTNDAGLACPVTGSHLVKMRCQGIGKLIGTRM